MNWRDIKKIDAHVHILPPERRAAILATPGSEHCWEQADISILLAKMDEANVEKALLVPNNDARMYYDMRATNEFLAGAVRKASGRLLAFADLNLCGSADVHDAPKALEHAVKELGLCGLKIHPGNLDVPADDLRLVPVLRKAAELGVPVMYHSYPFGPGFYDMCSPERINRMVRIFPDIKFITAHMGGMQHMDALRAVSYVDISYGLPELVEIYGAETANRILRKFGIERLIFGTDYPIVPYEEYFNILDKMDFTDEEKVHIAYGNIADILGI